MTKPAHLYSKTASREWAIAVTRSWQKDALILDCRQYRQPAALLTGEAAPVGIIKMPGLVVIDEVGTSASKEALALLAQGTVSDAKGVSSTFNGTILIGSIWELIGRVVENSTLKGCSQSRRTGFPLN